jgi:DNA ligase-associated metallophosphoesterase
VRRITLAGELIDLLPDRAIWWERRSTLLIADLHLGKAATFRAMGIPAPEATTARDLDRLAAAIGRLGARRLVILGDMIHAAEGRSSEVFDAFNDWRGRHAALDMLLVRGNHDERAGDPPSDWRIECHDGPHADGPFLFQHQPGESDTRHVLCGHIHPAVRLFGRAESTLRAPCFWVGERRTVLPAFGSFTGAKAIRPIESDRVFAIGDSVIEVKGPGTLTPRSTSSP